MQHNKGTIMKVSPVNFFKGMPAKVTNFANETGKQAIKLYDNAKDSFKNNSKIQNFSKAVSNNKETIVGYGVLLSAFACVAGFTYSIVHKALESKTNRKI